MLESREMSRLDCCKMRSIDLGLGNSFGSMYAVHIALRRDRSYQSTRAALGLFIIS